MDINRNYCALSEEIKYLFSNSNDEYILSEIDKKNNVHIEIKIKTDNKSVLFENTDKKLQKYFVGLFSNKKCADYILLTINNGKFDVHIFELCKTYNNKKSDLLKQLEGAFLRINSILKYCIHIKINDYIFYCVTQNFDTTPTDYRFYDKGNKISKFPKEEFNLQLNYDNLFYGNLEVFILKSDYGINDNILEYKI